MSNATKPNTVLSEQVNSGQAASSPGPSHSLQSLSFQTTLSQPPYYCCHPALTTVWWEAGDRMSKVDEEKCHTPSHKCQRTTDTHDSILNCILVHSKSQVLQWIAGWPYFCFIMEFRLKDSIPISASELCRSVRWLSVTIGFPWEPQITDASRVLSDRSCILVVFNWETEQGEMVFDNMIKARGPLPS